MPVKPLPRELVRRLRKAAGRIDPAFGKMKNIDYRANENLKGSGEKGDWGRRVRQMHIARNYPDIDLVIKRVHADSRESRKTPGNAGREIA